MLSILFSVTILLVLSPASSAQGDNSCRACNCQFNNIKFLTDLIRAEVRNTYVPWIPVTRTLIGTDQLLTATTLTYNIASIIPNTAQGVLLYSDTFCGYSSNLNMAVDITYYVVENGVRYEHFLRTYAYTHDAVNTNSENMWFPMPSDRKVYVEVPIAFPPGNCFTRVSVIGYR